MSKKARLLASQWDRGSGFGSQYNTAEMDSAVPMRLQKLNQRFQWDRGSSLRGLNETAKNLFPLILKEKRLRVYFSLVVTNNWVGVARCTLEIYCTYFQFFCCPECDGLVWYV
jgi:hypothetical protein